MRLYAGVYSGYSQKVRIALAEKRLTEEVSHVTVPADEKEGVAHRKRHPLGLVPVLELDDGSYLPESTPIIEYVDALRPDPPLFPKDPLSRAKAHFLDHYNDQGLTPPVRRLWRQMVRLAPGERDTAIVHESIRAIHNVYRYLEGWLADGPYLVGEFSIADIAFMQRLQILPMLDVTVPSDCPRVRQWESRLRARSSWDTTMYPSLPQGPA